MIVLVALLVCLIPTTIGALLSAIGIAGMDRLVQRNVLAMSGRAVEAAATARRCCSTRPARSRSATARRPSSSRRPASTASELADAAQLSSLADETPEGRSIVVLAKERYGLRGRELHGADARPVHRADADERRRPRRRAAIRKGAADAIRRWVEEQGGSIPPELGELVDGIASSGGTPLVVAENGRALGVIHLKDVVKEGMQRALRPSCGRWASAP